MIIQMAEAIVVVGLVAMVSREPFLFLMTGIMCIEMLFCVVYLFFICDEHRSV